LKASVGDHTEHSAECGHLGSPSHAVFGFPAVRGFEYMR
jgi:hypothetical protein